MNHWTQLTLTRRAAASRIDRMQRTGTPIANRTECHLDLDSSARKDPNNVGIHLAQACQLNPERTRIRLSVILVRSQCSWQVSQRIWRLTDWTPILSGVGISRWCCPDDIVATCGPARVDLPRRNSSTRLLTAASGDCEMLASQSFAARL